MANNFPDLSVEWHRHLSLCLPRELRELWEGSCESPNCPIKRNKLKIWSRGMIGDGKRSCLCTLVNSYLGSPQLMEPFCLWNLLPAKQISSIFNNFTRRNSTSKITFSLYKMPTAPSTSLLSLQHAFLASWKCKNIANTAKDTRTVFTNQKAPFIWSCNKAGKILEL